MKEETFVWLAAKLNPTSKESYLLEELCANTQLCEEETINLIEEHDVHTLTFKASYKNGYSDFFTPKTISAWKLNYEKRVTRNAELIEDLRCVSAKLSGKLLVINSYVLMQAYPFLGIKSIDKIEMVPLNCSLEEILWLKTLPNFNIIEQFEYEKRIHYPLEYITFSRRNHLQLLPELSLILYTSQLSIESIRYINLLDIDALIVEQFEQIDWELVDFLASDYGVKQKIQHIFKLTSILVGTKIPVKNRSNKIIQPKQVILDFFREKKKNSVTRFLKRMVMSF